MIKSKSLVFAGILLVSSLTAQESKKGIFAVKKIGFLYNDANENNFLFDDKDYSYKSKTYKFQAFYTIGNWKNIDFELILQPQIQTITHQLLNEQFVLPSEKNYLEKRIEFTTPKIMSLYAMELGFVLQKKLLKKLHIQATVGLGIATIDTRTERLAKGFTFIENGSLGVSFQTSHTTFLYVGTTIGHVSNLNFTSPNSGYNLLGYEIGVSYVLQ